MEWKAAALVALGGALGAAARFATSNIMPKSTFPWATLSVNLLGSLALGFFFLENSSDRSRWFFAIGFLGAFTTLSTYSVETVNLVRDSQVKLAALNMFANGIGGPLCALAGWRMASML